MLDTTILTPAPEGGFTALNPATGSVSEGETIDQPVANLREAVERYLPVFAMRLAGTPLVTALASGRHA